MPPHIRRSFINPDLRLRALDGADGQPSRTIEGYAILFNTESAPFEDTPSRLVVESIAPDAVTRDLLDRSDIKLLFNHDNSRLLARSVNGEGTLTYDIDERGVSFRAELPATPDGDMILELVRRGDLRGCSFCFSADYSDPASVAVRHDRDGDRRKDVIVIRSFTGIYDFSVVTEPAYPDTSVALRALDRADVIAAEPAPLTDTFRATRAIIHRLTRIY